MEGLRLGDGLPPHIDNMKRLIIGSWLILMFAGVAWADDDVPKQLNFARYQSILDHSPFAVATAAPATTAPDFAKDLFIANAAHSEDADLVTLASKSDN